MGSETRFRHIPGGHPWLPPVRVGVTVALLLLAAASLSARQRAAESNYVIGPHDVLTITVFGEADISKAYTVDADGKFTFKWIGRVQAAGLTVPALENDLKNRLKPNYLTHPEVSVAVQQYASKQALIVGEVRTPGAVPIAGSLSLLEALMKAGGALPTASGDILIVRATDAKPAGVGVPPPDGDGQPGEAPPPDTIKIDLNGLLAGAVDLDVPLQDGDQVFVPRAASLYIVGQVKSPGAYPVPKNTTLQQALALAGGPTPDAAVGRISIKRTIKGKLVELKVGKNFKLTDFVQPGDTVVVPERRF